MATTGGENWSDSGLEQARATIQDTCARNCTDFSISSKASVCQSVATIHEDPVLGSGVQLFERKQGFESLLSPGEASSTLFR